MIFGGGSSFFPRLFNKATVLRTLAMSSSSLLGALSGWRGGECRTTGCDICGVTAPGC